MFQPLRLGTAAISTVVLLATWAAAAPREDHEREYWRAIASSGYAVPAGVAAAALARELEELLGSSDPELRDALAYTILATWIERRALPTDQLRSVVPSAGST